MLVLPLQRGMSGESSKNPSLFFRILNGFEQVKGHSADAFAWARVLHILHLTFAA